MGEFKGIFLGKEYILPEELIDYAKDLKKFELYYERAMEPLIRQMQERTYSSGAEKDFAYFKNPLKEITEDIIKDLSFQGVFSVSVKELFDDNMGYQKLFSVCSECFEKIKDIYVNATLNLAQEYDNAYDSATSQITGLDYSIISNSASALITYGILQSNTINKQSRRAEQEYRARVSDLNKRHDNEIEEKKAVFLVNIYYPRVAEAISVFIDELFNKYIVALTNKGKYDNEIKCYNIEHSISLLQNLSLIEEKENVIREAFESCPYNISVYTSAVEYGIFDKGMLDIANKFGFDKEVVQLLNEYVLAHKADLNDIKHEVTILALYNHINEKELYKDFYKEEISAIEHMCNVYLEIYENKLELIRWIEKNVAKTCSEFVRIPLEQIKNKVLEPFSSDLIKQLISNDIISKENFIPKNIRQNLTDEDDFDLLSKVISGIEDYKTKIAKHVLNYSKELGIKESKYKNAKRALTNREEELDYIFEETKQLKNSLSFFAFSKKKELDRKLEEIDKERKTNELIDIVLKAENDYKNCLKKMETFIQ